MGGGDYFDFRGSTFNGKVIGKAEYQNAAPSPTTTSVLPAPPAAFTGREDAVAALLHTLDPAVGDGSEPVAISAVAGLGGVGKTALALFVAHAARQRGWFPGGALFIDLHGYDDVPEGADQAVMSLLRALGISDADLPSAAADRYGRFRQELSCREAMLIVLDNVSDPAQIVPLFPGEGAGHRVLITSREVLDSLPVRQFSLAALAPDASRTLVERSLHRTDPHDRRVADEPEAVRELTDLCGHLPLALLIAAALLRRRKRRPIATLAEELRQATDRVRALRARGTDQYDRQLELQPVLDVMYTRLDLELARVFRLLGQMPGDDIGTGAAAHLTALPPEQLEPYLEDLTAASLLGPSAAGGRWRMHDLVRLYARSVVAEAPELAKEAAEARGLLLQRYYYPAAREAKFQVQEPERVSRWFEGGRDHALAWLDTERAGLLVAAQWTEAEDPEQARTAMWLALALDTYLELRRAFDDSTILAVAARDTAHRLDIPEAEAMAWDMLGVTFTRLRRFDEALDAHRQALDIHTALEDADGQARTWHNAALALSGLRRYAEALDAKERSLRSYLELGDQRQTATVRTTLGITLDESGRSEEARGLLVQALAEHRAAGNLLGQATAANSLGVALLHLGRHDESVAALRSTLGLAAELGEWHLRAKAWNNLGLALQGLELFDEATDAHKRACDWNIFLGDAHTEATAWLNLGGALLNLRRPEEAVDAFQQALDLFKASGDSFYVGNTLIGRAAAYAMRKLTSEARSAFIAAAEAYELAGAETEAANARRLAGL